MVGEEEENNSYCTTLPTTGSTPFKFCNDTSASTVVKTMIMVVEEESHSGQ